MRVLRASTAAASLAFAAHGAAGCIVQPTAEPPRESICDSRAALSTENQFGSGLPDKTLALTFDDGPAERTEELSAYLRDQGIAATFFVIGQWVEGQEWKLDQLVADGHLLGNATTSHQALSTLSPAEVVSEIASTHAFLQWRVAPNQLYLRPPFGDWTPELQKIVAASEMSAYRGPVAWDIGNELTATGAADWDCWDAANGTRTVTECGDLYLTEIRAKRRGIVLLHDGPPFSLNPTTVDMVKYMIPILKAEGYKFARIDQVRLRNFEFEGAPDTDVPPPDRGGDGAGEAQSSAPKPPVDPCR